VGTFSRAQELRAQLKSEGGDVSGRHVRASWSLPAFAIFVTFAFLAVSLAPPPSGSATYAVAPGTPGETQSFQAGAEHTNGIVRDDFEITEIPTAPVAPAAGVPDPDTAQGIAWTMVQARGWDLSEFSCLVALWTRESNWNVYAHNASSGAYGIPQSLPGEKMASVGADWATNPATQITWGLGYIQARYETPCGAWGHSEEEGWY
jgi:hypothetical protein